jgi:hypothetical protein
MLDAESRELTKITTKPGISTIRDQQHVHRDM